MLQQSINSSTNPSSDHAYGDLYTYLSLYAAIHTDHNSNVAQLQVYQEAHFLMNDGLVQIQSIMGLW